jgi:hypothetical protein
VRWGRALRDWVFANRLLKRLRHLQEYQIEESNKMIDDLRRHNRGIFHELADEVLRLSALSDSLETSLEDMRREEGG